MSKYQANIAGSQASIGAFIGWAGNGTGSPPTTSDLGISYIMGQLGFTLQTDTYTAQWLNATNAGSSALPQQAAATGLNGTAFPTVSNTARTALASSNFLGAYNSGTTYAAGSVVTYATTGLVYMAITSGTGNAPTNTSFWSPYYMEIWGMVAAGQTTLYIKFEYGCSSSGVLDPMLTMQVGTGWSSGNSGYLTGNVSLTELLFNGAGTIAATECDFAGDGQNYFVANMFRGGAANPGPAIFGVERAISGIQSSAPVYNSNYATYIKGYSAAGNWYQQTLFLSGSPTTATRVNYGNTMTLGNATASLIVNNTTPALPVFPLLGYVGNPMTIICAQQEADTTEGATQSCTVYGTTHNYIATKTTFALAFAGAGQTSSYGVLTRFD